MWLKDNIYKYYLASTHVIFINENYRKHIFGLRYIIDSFDLTCFIHFKNDLEIVKTQIFFSNKWYISFLITHVLKQRKVSFRRKNKKKSKSFDFNTGGHISVFDEFSCREGYSLKSERGLKVLKKSKIPLLNTN